MSFQGKKHTADWKDKVKSNPNHQRTVFKKGQNLGNTNGFKKGQIAWNKGKERTWESPTQFIKGHHLSDADKHWNWKGGISAHYFLKNMKKPEQCEICGSIGRICYDHDHNTGKFRGWLCNRCNLTLGLVKDNTETLIALANYVKKSLQEKN